MNKTLHREGYWQGEILDRHKDGHIYPKWLTITAVKDSDDKTTHYVANFSDISERKRAEEHIHYLANFDPLTGLPNRAQLNDHLTYAYALRLAKRSNGHLAFMFLDLDHFKDINDSLGHSIGDILLIELSKRLRMALREEDTVTRLGGDEFILLLPEIDAIGAAHVAQKLLDTIAKPYRIEHYDLMLTASVGIALYPEDGEDLETLSKSADTAMYRAKQEGRQCYRFFTPGMQARSARNLRLVNALRHALDREQLQVYYQPALPELVTRILDEEGLSPEYLEPELTESVAMHNPQGAIAVMDNLYERDITTEPEDKAIVSAIINLAKSLGLQTIAEGVEKEGQLAFLREQGCDEMQGYLFSKPVPANQFEALLN